MSHVIVSRFSVPRLDQATSDCHLDRRWLAGRVGLFRHHFVPSVERLGVPTILLCSSASADYVAREIEDLDWAEVKVQDDWHGGWQGSSDETITRLDSDDAVHEGWFRALDEAPPGYDAYCTRRFLRLDSASGRLYSYRRREPSPLAAFPGGRNPYAHDHADLPQRCRVHHLSEAYLLQVVHGGNVSNRRPSWRRYFQQISHDRLVSFGLPPEAP